MVPNGNYFEYLAQEIHRISHIAKKYSSTDISSKNKKEIYKLNSLLQRLSDKDTGSSELLCFGYHVLARKK